MMLKIKRLLLFFITLSIVFGMKTVSANAQKETTPVEPIEVTYVNPLYQDVLNESDLLRPDLLTISEVDQYYTTVEAAGEALRNYIKN